MFERKTMLLSRSPDKWKRGGVFLIYTLSIIGLVLTLGLAFVCRQSMERIVADSFLNRVKAGLVAQAGIEKAIASLWEYSRNNPYDSPKAAWVFRNNENSDVGSGINVEKCIYPSFRHKTTGISDILGDGGYEDRDTYTLKIIDCASQINLNLSSPYLPQIINNLGEAILFHSPYKRDPVLGRGDMIVRLRDTLGGFRYKEELIPLLGHEDYNILKDYITVYGCKNNKSLAPDASSKYGLTVSPGFPVNINTASKPVLIAVLSVLKSRSCLITFTQAERIAHEIVKYRESEEPDKGPFYRWSQVWDFADSLRDLPNDHFSLAQAELFFVNASPNVILKFFNPERVISKGIDKSDLIQWSTEFTFSSQGYYEITSLGIINKGGKVCAQQKVTSTVQIYENLRESSQYDFEDGRVTGQEYYTDTFPYPTLLGVSAHHEMGWIQLMTPSPTVSQQVPCSFSLLRSKTNTTSGTEDEVRSINSPPFISPDGLIFSSKGEQIKCTLPKEISINEGTLTFWLKFNDNPLIIPLPILNIRTDNIVWQISVSVYSGDMCIESTRWLMSDKKEHGQYSNVTAFVSSSCFEHEWHHISISFYGLEQEVYLDGGKVGKEKNVKDTPAPPILEDRVLYLGKDPVSNLSKSFTIDEVRLFDKRLPPFKLCSLERFEQSNQDYVGVFCGSFPPLPDGARLGNISWQEWIPWSYCGKKFAEKIPPINMAVGICPNKEHGKSGKSGEDGTGVNGSDGNQNSNINKNKPVNYRILKESCNFIPLKRGSKLDSLLPAVQVSSCRVYYEILFTNPSRIFPLNVTPIVVDLTLTYQVKPRFLRVEFE